MKLNRATALFVVALIPCAAVSAAITIETVPVGDVGNPSDTGTPVALYGGVGYVYSIAKYEVTVGQYTAFLNAVAATDTNSLFSPLMGNPHIAGISRSGSPGSYTYSVIGSPNHPVAAVTWGDAARFANWLHNGQPSGPQGIGTTEDGAYTLDGAHTSAALMAVTRNADAKWFIPTENEWYKAAYYQPAAKGGDVNGYWDYPMKTNSAPHSDQPPGVPPAGNFFQHDNIANGYDDGYAVTGSTNPDSNQNLLTDVGAYTSSRSYYGTFDQGGNVWEWNETAASSTSRGYRGGSWDSGGSIDLRSIMRLSAPPLSEQTTIGFRVASIPEPSTLLLVAIGSLGMALRRQSLR